MFLQRIGQLSSLAAFPLTSRSDGGPRYPWTDGELENLEFRLSVSPPENLGLTRLVHLPTGLVLADRNYSYSFGRAKFRESSISRAPDGSSVISLRGEFSGHLGILHEFRIPHKQPWIEEQITLLNQGSLPLDLDSWRCGFVLPLPPPAGGKLTVLGPNSNSRLSLSVVSPTDHEASTPISLRRRS